MIKKIKNNKGFTLIELLIAMSIFIIFIGILLNSYTSIITEQRNANDYRIMYSEARRVFDTVVQELRDGMVDYGNVNQRCDNRNQFRTGVSELYMVSKDGLSKTHIKYEENAEGIGIVKIQKGSLFVNGIPGEDPNYGEWIDLNSTEVNVKDFKFYVYPYVDSYDPQYVFDTGYQFHPKVTLFATFEKEKHSGDPYEISLQTTISSRIYNQVYPTENCSS